MSRASKIYITWPFNIQIAEINLNRNTTKRIFHPVYEINSGFVVYTRLTISAGELGGAAARVRSIGIAYTRGSISTRT